jgi:hypothetical protein
MLADTDFAHLLQTHPCGRNANPFGLGEAIDEYSERWAKSYGLPLRTCESRHSDAACQPYAREWRFYHGP